MPPPPLPPLYRNCKALGAEICQTQANPQENEGAGKQPGLGQRGVAANAVLCSPRPPPTRTHLGRLRGVHVCIAVHFGRFALAKLWKGGEGDTGSAPNQLKVGSSRSPWLPRGAGGGTQLTGSLEGHLHGIGNLLLLSHGAEVRQAGPAKLLLANGHLEQGVVRV